ncbi:chorismate synthase [Helicobacter sp. 13S00401-1]|uniref:chorismate synthase n=1 Tax=Helicobacter sp. 13S00401-1 TaxID=1905758 RepID=UPI000BA695FD|nr:chorismate synthase [Helicobacter sp. 13S00401-1]PAF48803.1 chorismate synthase [Helicobacter sp. 13S00401-1]
MDSMGERLVFTSFGESHGEGIGGVLSGLPAGLKIDMEFLEAEVARRKGGSKFATPRKEEDSFKILSGVFEGVSTGAALGFFVPNENTKSKDYSEIKDIFRPAHADFTYFKKYGLRDYKGGGRASARESVARVLAGGFAKLLLREFDIEVHAGVMSIEKIGLDYKDFDKEAFLKAKESEVFALDTSLESSMKEIVLEAKREGDSLGASVLIKAFNIPVGLGEPMYHKLDSMLASSLMGLNGVKAVEIGLGTKASQTRGSINNDFLYKDGFKTNNSGGILGGISNGDTLVLKAHFKPTPSIFLEQASLNTSGDEVNFKLKGRHDPCIGIRGSVVCESLVALVLADALLLNATSKLDSLKKIYK